MTCLAAVDIVNFREVKTEREDNYDIAFVEGSISRESEIPRLQKIRNQAKIVIALGACACIGGVNCLKNHLPMDEALTDSLWGRRQILRYHAGSPDKCRSPGRLLCKGLSH